MGIKRSTINKKLRKMFADRFGGIKKAAIFYGVERAYLDNILRGAAPREDILADIGYGRELVKTERFYKLEGEK
jgi:hypothetical protein